MPPHLLVLPSPFLGPEPYEPVVAALSRRGYAASVAPSPATPVPGELLASWSALARESEEVVLLPHSNAGYYAPAVSSAAGAAPVVFVDAALPVTAGRTRLAPDSFRAQLADLTGSGGRLPRWTRWWSREDLAATLPDPWFAQVDEMLPEVPWAYLDAEVPVPSGWQAGRRAYLAFGDTYADELAWAEGHGWPRRRLGRAGHLHLLVAPDETAAAMIELVARIDAVNAPAPPGGASSRGSRGARRPGASPGR